MTNHMRVPLFGQGRTSTALGASDPRMRRNASAGLQTEAMFDGTIRVDDQGRIGVRGSRVVAKIKEGATMDELRMKLNELIQSQIDSGQMEGGR